MLKYLGVTGTDLDIQVHQSPVQLPIWAVGIVGEMVFQVLAVLARLTIRYDLVI